jgi:hypothetical protein
MPIDIRKLLLYPFSYALAQICYIISLGFLLNDELYLELVSLHELQDLAIVYIHHKLAGEVFHASETMSYLPQHLKLDGTTIHLKRYGEIANQINVLPAGSLRDILLQGFPLKVLKITTPKLVHALDPKEEVVLQRVQGHETGKVYHKCVDLLFLRRLSNRLQSEVDEIGPLMGEVPLEFMNSMAYVKICSQRSLRFLDPTQHASSGEQVDVAEVD